MRRCLSSIVLMALAAPLTFADAPRDVQAKPPVVKAAKLAGPATRPAPVDPRLKTPEKFVLKDGDTVVFLGDSITHQCLYTQYLEDFFYTRLPGTHVHFHNAGVNGDRAADALARFGRGRGCV